VVADGFMNDIESESQLLRARIRCFVSASEVPRVVVSFHIDPKSCDACGKPITERSTHYEVLFSTLSFRLDADCYGIWAEEMLRSNAKREIA